MTWPPHQNPSSGRAASAPYNFVPLPEAVVEAAGGLPPHDEYDPDRNTGHFDVMLTTRSPLYIRAPLTLEEFRRQGEDYDDFRRDPANKADFFHTREGGPPVIPGSSLHGMLRGLVEIVSYGKMRQVTDKDLFYRTMDGSSLSNYYTDRLGGNVETGFLQRGGDGYHIQRCDMVRVDRSKLKKFGRLYDGSGPNKTPQWSGKVHQGRTVWVQLSGDDVSKISVERQDQSPWKEGRLIITGDIPGKKKEFVFLLPESNVGSTESVGVPDEMVGRFHSPDQLTRWQRNAFPRDQPETQSRPQGGMLRKEPGKPGDPVFFLREHDELVFFGRAQMFRLPYQNTPRDMVPEKLRRAAPVDYAEALFGYAKGDDTPIPSAYAGRVSVTDATLAAPDLAEQPGRLWLKKPDEDPLEPEILSSPKPTCIQHYLVQESDDTDELRHYDSNTPDDESASDETVIRGHKRYWHRGDVGADQIAADEADSEQYTQMRPVKSGVDFHFRVEFENLSDAEMGALCWALHPQGDPDQDYCHKLGMGKPLGLGAVKLAATLHLEDRQARYESLFNDDGWETSQQKRDSPPDTDDFRRFVREFEEGILSTLQQETTEADGQTKRLRDLDRIGMLLTMMQWRQEPLGNTEYMDLGDFGDRLVLQDPQTTAAWEALDPDGRLKWYSAKKGYGFIEPEDGGDDVFVHGSNVEGLSYGEGMSGGEPLKYDVEETDKGLSALNVQRLNT